MSGIEERDLYRALAQSGAAVYYEAINYQDNRRKVAQHRFALTREEGLRLAAETPHGYLATWLVDGECRSEEHFSPRHPAPLPAPAPSAVEVRG